MRSAIRTLTICCALSAATLLGACKDKNTPTLGVRRTPLPDSVDQMMFGVRQELLTNGVRRGRLQADTALFLDQGRRVELKHVNTIFYDAAGAQNGTMTAQTGVYDVQTQKLDGRGNVVVTTTDGRKLTSPHLVYEQSVNQISSDTSFAFTQPGRELTGIGFRSDPQLRNVTVLRGVGGHTVVPSGGARHGPAAGAKP